MDSIAFTRPTLTPFDRLIIDEAYARCYGLREAVQRGELADLAHQTGFRVEYLTDLSNAVIAHPRPFPGLPDHLNCNVNFPPNSPRPARKAGFFVHL